MIRSHCKIYAEVVGAKMQNTETTHHKEKSFHFQKAHAPNAKLKDHISLVLLF